MCVRAYACKCMMISFIHMCASSASRLPVCYGMYGMCYGMLKNIGLFCKRALQKRPVFCKETCIFKHPTHRSHPIWDFSYGMCYGISHMECVMGCVIWLIHPYVCVKSMGAACVLGCVCYGMCHMECVMGWVIWLILGSILRVERTPYVVI